MEKFGKSVGGEVTIKKMGAVKLKFENRERLGGTYVCPDI